jgi:PhnB protein
MTETVKPIPENRTGAIPRLSIRNAGEALDFYKKAFGAHELFRLTHNGKIGHAEITIGQALVMLNDESPESDALSPAEIGGTPVVIHLYVADVDVFAAKAIASGLKVLRPIADQFYGDRGGKFEDPFGHRWWIATHKEDVSPEEMKRRAGALFGG